MTETWEGLAKYCFRQSPQVYADVLAMCAEDGRWKTGNYEEKDENGLNGGY